MQPSFDLRIRTMMKALAETVLPAVDPTRSAAIEQGHLVLASLEVLRQQVEYAHWFEVVDARDMAALVAALAAVAKLPSAAECLALIEESRQTVARFDVPLSAIREANRRVRIAIHVLMGEAFALNDAAVDERITSLVLAHAEAQVSRERAYVANCRFDVYPDNLQSIESALKCPSRVGRTAEELR